MTDKTEYLEKICNTLDKLTLDALHLMEEEIELKLNVENAMSNGESNLAKARYIMGQNNVCSLQLPSENSKEFSAAIKVFSNSDEKSINGQLLELRTIKKSEDDTVLDPLRWFGVLVPQNLTQAQNMFKQALQWAVQAINTQTQLKETINKIYELKQVKAKMSSTQ